MFRSLILKAARLYKGSSYNLDPNIPLFSVFFLAWTRVVWAVRAMFNGYGLSLNPKNFIFFGPNSELKNRSKIQIGAGSTIGRGVYIDGLSRSGVKIGLSVNIGSYSIIEATGVISNLGEGLTIGSCSGIGAFSFIGAAGGVRIGNNVIMGQRVSFHSENHNFNDLSIPIRMQGVERLGIVIGDDCWIGANVTFLDGVSLGRGCVVGAGSVVRGVIPEYSVVAGVPGRVIRDRRS